MIILAAISCAAVAVCFLTNPRQESFDITIVVPAGSQEGFVYSDEEISPTKNQIIIASGENLGDTEVVLKPVEAKQEHAYEPTYLSPGMPVKMDAEKGAWFKVGINMQNPSDEDMVVHVNVKNLEVRISSKTEIENPLEQYRTDYIGDAPKVSAIAQRLTYPRGYTYSSIELRTSAEPYELMIYLDGSGDVSGADFKNCADIAFDLIGNMEMITFLEAETGNIFASYDRNGEISISTIGGADRVGS